MKITKEEYDRRLKAYITADTSQASGFYGNWARYIKLKREFDQTLVAEGYDQLDEEPR